MIKNTLSSSFLYSGDFFVCFLVLGFFGDIFTPQMSTKCNTDYRKMRIVFDFLNLFFFYLLPYVI